MKKHIVSLILSTAMAASTLTAAPAFAEQTAENNTVSGYISLSDGIKFAGDGVTPVIYVDDRDYDGVKIAAENMAEDIKKVTDITAEINPSAAPLAADLLSENSGEKPAIAEINPLSKSMTISGYQSLTAKGRGIIAVYDGNKLEEIGLSENLADNTNGSLTFSAMPSFDGKNVKGFLWEDNDGLTVKPLADAFDYTQSDEPTMKPDDEYAEIIIGTYGVSDTITALADSGAIDVSDIKNKWEAFTIRKTPDNKIVIAGSDKRGTIYGIYDFCEKIGVSPWEWWADVTPVHADRLYINLPDGGYTEGQSSVKYRGIFLNDEFNFCNWSKSLSDDGETNMSPEAYKRVYELILRLKANMMWPAMHNYSNAFHSNPENARLADEYGVVIGSSHAEPLLRNNLGELYDYQVEWETAHPDKTLYKPEKDEDGHSVAWMWTDHNGKETTGDPVDNKEFLTDYWRDSVKKFGSYENIYTLGMRGVHDGPFNTNMESWSGALQEIINTQYNILKDELCGGDAEKVKEIPKVFIPYKDVLQYYNNGSLTIPDDVTVMWTDDNYGYTRQNANEAERARAGRAGVYYHISYYGNPSSYLWISSTQPGLIREELGKAYDMGADRMWLLNVGDLKPAEKEIEYYAELGRNIETTRNKDISETYADNAKRDFNMNDMDAAEYASIMDKYYELANSNRPEFIRSGNFSLTAYGDEAERYIAEYENICERAETLYNKLAKDKKDAFFELALYPIRGAKNMAVNYIQTDRAIMYAEQNRGQAVNTCAAQAQEALDAIGDDIGYYNTTLANGKWNGMANINPSHFTDCDMPLKYDQLAKPSVEKLDYAELDVITESGDKSMTVSAYDSYDNYFDVVNRGYGSFEYEITSTSEAITLDKTSGTVYGSDRIYVGVDKAKAAASSSATVTVKQMLGESVVDTKDIIVNILNPDISDAGEKTYIETNGTVSVEAEHYSRLADNGGYRWQIENDFGRSGDSLKVYPNLAADVNNTAESIKANSACAEYDVYFTTPGTYTVNIYRMPTLNARGTCRVAVGLDDGSPVSIGGTNNSPTSTSDSKRGSGNSWVKQVLANSEVLTAAFTNVTAGKHTLKLYNVSSGMVIDKIVLAQNIVPSYFGAPESYNTTYNTEKLSNAKPTDNETKDITKIFEPKAVAGVVSRSGNKITIPLYALDSSLTDAVTAVTAYDNNGFMTECDFAKVTFTDGAAEATLTLSESAANYAVTVFDNFTSLSPIAPYREYGNIVTASNTNSISVNKELGEYADKKSIILVADTDISENITSENIKYLRGETLTEKSYKNIPFETEPESKYSIRVGIDGEAAVDDKINILPDRKGEDVLLFNENFENNYNTSGWQGTKANLSVAEDNTKYLKFTTGDSSTGAYTKTDAIDCAGKTVHVEADLKFTAPGGSKPGNSQFTIGGADPKFSGDNPDWGIIDSSAGHIIAFEYNNASALKVNRKTISTDFIGDWMHISAEVNFGTRKIALTLTNDSGMKEELSDLDFFSTNNITEIGSVYLRAAGASGTTCVDNLKVYQNAAPEYAIEIKAVDAADEEAVSNAEITVADSLGNTVLPEADGEFAGKYMLSAGSYTVTAKADGYADSEQLFELSPATASKTVTIPMYSPSQSKTASITIRFADEEGNTLKDDVNLTETYFELADGTLPAEYTVPEEYKADFVIKTDDGLYDLYRFNPGTSELTAEYKSEMTLTLKFNNTDQYNYYNDFENLGEAYTSDWHKQSSGDAYPTIETDKTEYLKYSAAGSSSTGTYTLFENAVDAANKKVEISADVKFADSGSGLGQFAISDSSPSFGSGNINYGIENSNGHIFALMYRPTGNTLKLNGETINTRIPAGDWIHINAEADFANKKVTVKLTSENGTVYESEAINFYSGSVNDNIGSIYLRSPGSGSLSVDNVTVKITGNASFEPNVESPLNLKSVYAFGDSIVYGHNTPAKSFMRLIADDYAMSLNMMAKNGATIMPSSNQILTQINNAPSAAPDFVVFEGYTNDAYGAKETDTFNSSGTQRDVTQCYGEVTPDGTTAFNTDTFCGSFENTVYTMKQKWPESKFVYVTIHKSNARNLEIQEKLRELAMEMCEKWDIEVVDMFTYTNETGETLDTSGHTNNDEYMKKYIINGSGSHPTEAACREFYIPAVVEKMEGLLKGE